MPNDIQFEAPIDFKGAIEHITKSELYHGVLHVINSVVWIERSDIDTMSVSHHNGYLAMLWNKTFVDKLDDRELSFVLLHEAFHIYLGHLSRIGDYPLELMNYAMDVVVNETIERTGGRGTVYRIPDIIDPIMRPHGYNGYLTVEDLILWLDSKSNQWKKRELNRPELSNHGPMNSTTEEDITKSSREIARTVLTENNTDKDFIKRWGYSQKKPSMLDGLKSNIEISGGKGGGKLSRLIQMLQSVSSGGLRESSWRKINRRGFDGLRGRVKRGRRPIVILDVSGSMTENNMYKLVLERANYKGFDADIILVDMEVRAKVNIKQFLRKGGWRGVFGGGTFLQPGIDTVTSDPNTRESALVVITDGYCDELDFRKHLGPVLVVYTEFPPAVKGAVKMFHLKERL